MDRNFIGAGKRLEDIDLPRLGHKIGVGEDEIHAFLDVETRGHGFDSRGRPVILFEPHVFYRNLAAAQRSEAVAKGLAYPRWGEQPYPADSYPRLVAACEIDETAALKSASWGLGQVLGENFEAAGFLTVQAMVKGMMDSEEVQLEAAINFIVANRLDDNLRAHDWAGFAAGYNGKSYRANQYDVKLADSFRKWSRIADTPWAPSTDAPVIAARPPTPPQPAAKREPQPLPAPSVSKPVAAAGAFALIVMALAGFWHQITGLFWSIF